MKRHYNQLNIEPLVIGLLVLLAIGGTFAATKSGSVFGFLNKVTIDQNQIDAAHAAYAGGFQVWAVRYRCLYDNSPVGCVDSAGHKLPQNRCPTGVHTSLANLCGERDVVVRIQSIDASVQAQFAQVDVDYAACVANSATGACSGLPAAYKAVQEAINAAKAFGIQFGFSG